MHGSAPGSGFASSVIMIAAIGNDKQSDPSTSSSVQWSQQCRHFEFSEILLATKNFDESLVIGQGGFGKVYRGTIFDGSAPVLAAIKRLDPSSNQGAPEFWAEVEMLSKFRHCNLVSLFGYCSHEKEMILVYEYMPNGTLEDHLHKLRAPLSWIQRLNICIGAARGLHYLHTGTGIEVGVIHRDVKSSNILLHETWAAKISDFGLSKIGPTNKPSTGVNTVVKGTFGYLDPDYYTTGKLTRKSDVYAFGVVLLEVLCRKRAVFDIDKEAVNLAIWAQESIKEGKLKNIIDPDLRGQISPKCSKDFVRITKRCLHSSPKKRYTMNEVLYNLESLLDSQENFNNSVQPAGRTIFDRMVNYMLPFPSNGENTAQGDSKPSSEGKSRIGTITIGADNKFRDTSELPADYEESSEGKSIIGTNTVGADNNTFLDTSELPADYEARSLKEFEYYDLKKATKNFSPDMLLGVEGIGEVYLGWVDQNTFAPSKSGVGVPVAVKRNCQDSFQSQLEWQAEVSFLGRLAHPNIINILGYCSNEHEHLLVYEYMGNQSFAGFLFENTAESLSWGTRLMIMIGVARGLTYLHSSKNQVTCQRVKASEILVDKDFTAKLAYFRLKESYIYVPTMVQTNVMFHGDLLYSSPEYMATGYWSPKSDIYGFGLLLLETLAGIRAFDKNRATKWRNLVDRARPILRSKRELKKIMDPRLEQNYPLEGAFKCVSLALRCLENDPKNRPSSKEVLQSLENIDAARLIEDARQDFNISSVGDIIQVSKGDIIYTKHKLENGHNQIDRPESSISSCVKPSH